MTVPSGASTAPISLPFQGDNQNDTAKGSDRHSLTVDADGSNQAGIVCEPRSTTRRFVNTTFGPRVIALTKSEDHPLLLVSLVPVSGVRYSFRALS